MGGPAWVRFYCLVREAALQVREVGQAGMVSSNDEGQHAPETGRVGFLCLPCACCRVVDAFADAAQEVILNRRRSLADVVQQSRATSGFSTAEPRGERGCLQRNRLEVSSEDLPIRSGCVRKRVGVNSCTSGMIGFTALIQEVYSVRASIQPCAWV